MKKAHETYKWRASGHYLYLQVGDKPSVADYPIGSMSSPDLANYVVTAVNSPRLVPVDEARRAAWRCGCGRSQ